MQEGQKRGLFWDLAAANRAIRFFPDVLRLAEGEHAGHPFVLQPWQAFVQGSLFGWKAADGFRRFRVAYIEIGKGNGKSPMAGGTGIYMMTADGEIGAHCFAAATTREQASILFQDAVNMVDASPKLKARITQSGKRHVFNLAHIPTGSFFRPVSAEGKGLDGKRVHYAALDEIHEHPNATVVDKMRAGTKGRRQALIYEITNSGYDRHSVCWRHHEYSRQILEGVLADDGWFAYVCQLDDGDDWADPKAWIKANPNLGVSVTEKYLQEQVREAKGMPGKENIVKRLNFCIWTEQSKRWMPMDKWDACRGDLSVPQLEELLIGEPCYGGLDLALTRDLSAFVLLFPPSPKHSDWKALCWFWCPLDDIKERSERDHVPYDVWAREGFLIATPGNRTDHDFIEKQINDLRKKYRILEVCFDPALAMQLVTHMQDAGQAMVEIRQGAQTLNPGVCGIERIVLGKELAHAGHPVLRWNCSNAVTKPDSNGNLKFDKEKATERIDGMSALANAGVRAFVAAPAPQFRKSVFDHGTFWN